MTKHKRSSMAKGRSHSHRRPPQPEEEGQVNTDRLAMRLFRAGIVSVYCIDRPMRQDDAEVDQ